jgi:hypothetical protein
VSEQVSEALEASPPEVGGIKKKSLIIIGAVTLAIWAFAVQTGSLTLLIVVGILTVLLIGVLVWALRQVRKQRGLVGLLRGAAASPAARKNALAELEAKKDANAPLNVFARAQLMASDDPAGALALLEPLGLKAYHAAMQDDVALLMTQLYLAQGRTQDARKTADTINVDNPDRKEVRAMAVCIVAEAWARTGKPKEALALLDTIEIPKADAQQLGLQARVARVFAKFASNQRGPARTELQQLADQDLNHLGRFLLPQFRVHPELQKLARRVLEQHPASRSMAKHQARSHKLR